MSKQRLHLAMFAVAAWVAWWSSTGTLSAQSMMEPPSPSGNSAARAGEEIMTRGPVHEAYAQPINTGAVSPLVINRKPPEAIEELPPDAKPADSNAVWISGYWSWDDERKNFLWTSGVWRVPPPGMRWVTGYWSQVPDGYQWVPGFWSAAGSEEVEYYPEPPASLEQGPTSNPPSADYVWISGRWRWHDGRYAWQPGYWAPGEANWVWVPASYYWSPRGWIFCDGFWDYPLARRGVIFAPVVFADAIYLRPGFRYVPSVVIDPTVLTFFLFVRPSYDHYYFGDYYAAGYDRLGIYPWFGVRTNRDYAYDPLFTYYRWRYSSRQPEWANNLRGWYQYYREHPDRRPPHDLAAQRELAASAAGRPDGKYLTIADSLASWRNKPAAPVKFVPLGAEQKARIELSVRQTHQLRSERAQLESRPTGEFAATPRGTPGRETTTPQIARRPSTEPQRLRLPDIAGAWNLQSPGAGRVPGGPPQGGVTGPGSEQASRLGARGGTVHVPPSGPPSQGDRFRNEEGAARRLESPRGNLMPGGQQPSEYARVIPREARKPVIPPQQPQGEKTPLPGLPRLQNSPGNLPRIESAPPPPPRTENVPPQGPRLENTPPPQRGHIERPAPESHSRQKPPERKDGRDQERER